MNMQKFTQKSLEAIQNSQNIAIENQNAQVEQEHLLLALIDQENSLIKELLKKMGTSEEFEQKLKSNIENKPKMTGGARPSDGIYDITRCRHNANKCRKNSQKHERRIYISRTYNDINIRKRK